MNKYKLLKKYVCLLSHINKAKIVTRDLEYRLVEYSEPKLGSDCEFFGGVMVHRFDISNFTLLDALGIVGISYTKEGYVIEIFEDSFDKLLYNIGVKYIKE